MKIKLAFIERYGKYGRERIVLKEVKATMPFQMFGYTFAAHPAVKPDGTFKDAKKCGWVVSEASTGSTAAYGDTRRGVIEEAKRRIMAVGAERARAEINKQLKLQKKYRQVKAGRNSRSTGEVGADKAEN